MSNGFYPSSAGLISYLFGSAYSVLGSNRWAKKEDAVEYAKKIQDYFPYANCNVIDEYFSEAPGYQWRVFCEGK